MADRDYVLGTHDDEVARLGLQHRVWRATVLECWQKAGITIGSRVLDVGAGPGYATFDLADIVGPNGRVVAVERSTNFVNVIRDTCKARNIGNVTVAELDLMTDVIPGEPFDFVWCRWVASFVSDPGILVRKIAGALRPGGRAIFHEYADYLSWRFSPRRPVLEKFAAAVMASWRESGGEPDIALALPPLLAADGCRIILATPRIFCAGPAEYAWNWSASFLKNGPARLLELGRIDQKFADEIRSEFAAAAANPRSLVMTPLVLEIVAEKLGGQLIERD